MEVGGVEGAGGVRCSIVSCSGGTWSLDRRSWSEPRTGLVIGVVGENLIEISHDNLKRCKQIPEVDAEVLPPHGELLLFHERDSADHKIVVFLGTDMFRKVRQSTFNVGRGPFPTG